MTVTHPEIRRYFMTIPEACRLVMEAATIGRGNTSFVFDMGECVKIAELARRMIALAGFRVDQDIRIVYTGLRPGEKLYEEVLSNTENTLPTAHEKIRIAKVREYDYEEACRDVEELERLGARVRYSERRAADETHRSGVSFAELPLRDIRPGTGRGENSLTET